MVNAQQPMFFKFKINSNRIDFKLLELAVFIRSHIFKRPYGDQGLLISRDLYFSLGGYRKLHLMEDLDLIIRLSKRTNLKCIGTDITTSFRKYNNTNIIKNSLKNAFLRNEWTKGEDSKTLAQRYYSNKKNN